MEKIHVILSLDLSCLGRKPVRRFGPFRVRSALINGAFWMPFKT
jgi:hypothetical protein